MKKPNEAEPNNIWPYAQKHVDAAHAIYHNINYPTDLQRDFANLVDTVDYGGHGGGVAGLGADPAAATNGLVYTGTFARQLRGAGTVPPPVPQPAIGSPEPQARFKITAGGLVVYFSAAAGEKEHALAALRRERRAAAAARERERSKRDQAAKMMLLGQTATVPTDAVPDALQLIDNYDPLTGEVIRDKSSQAKTVSGAAAGGGSASSWRTVRKWVLRLETWITSLRTLKAANRNNEHGYKLRSYYLTAITLTLPGTQNHSDKYLSRYALGPFIKWLVYNGCKNYFWKAEAQANGNIHWHILCDRYLVAKQVNEAWNSILAGLGYTTTGSKYKTGQAPSSFIEAVRWQDDLLGYLVEYVTKGQDDRRALTCRIMGSSDGLKHYIPYTADADYTLLAKLHEAAKKPDEPELEVTTGDYHTSFRVAKRVTLRLKDGRTRRRRENFVNGWLARNAPHIRRRVTDYYYSLACADYLAVPF